MSNRGYSSSGGYPQQNHMRPSYQSGGGYDQDRYYNQGRPGYNQAPMRPDRPEYYDRPSSGANGYRGGSNGYDDFNFRPWDQSYR